MPHAPAIERSVAAMMRQGLSPAESRLIVAPGPASAGRWGSPPPHPDR